MDELDKLKMDWKQHGENFRQFNEDDLYKMLHRRSSSIVKWILVISIIEIIVWTAIGLFVNSDDYLKKGHPDAMRYIQILNVVTYGVTLYFIYLFYRNFRRISVMSSTINLMEDILRTRKTVRNYVWYNLAMLAFGFVIGFTLAVLWNPDYLTLREKMDKDASILLLIFGVGLACLLIIIGFAWLIYKLIYGLLMKRLLLNYKELEKIDL